MDMKAELVVFPETQVASIAHRGDPALEYGTLRKLIAWKIENRLLDPLRYRSYGLHYGDPFNTPPADYRVDFCLSVDQEVGANSYGIETQLIPQVRCARARDVGSRANNQAAAYLYHVWLPQSGETHSGFPLIFHYVNVGPNVAEAEMITDVYLPLR